METSLNIQSTWVIKVVGSKADGMLDLLSSTTFWHFPSRRAKENNRSVCNTFGIYFFHRNTFSNYHYLVYLTIFSLHFDIFTYTNFVLTDYRDFVDGRTERDIFDWFHSHSLQTGKYSSQSRPVFIWDRSSTHFFSFRFWVEIGLTLICFVYT